MSEATLPPRITRPNDLSYGVKFSLILHLAVAILILVKSLVFLGEPEVYTPALRVDIVGLPDILKQDLAKLPPLPPVLPVAEEKPHDAPKEPRESAPVKSEPAEEMAEKDEMVLNAKRAKEAKQKEDKIERDRKKNMSNALARIKALNKISADDSPAAAPVIKGNQISKGTALTGEARESLNADYRDQLLDRIQRNWNLPVWLARQKYAAKVVIYIDAAGRLVNYRFTQPSGNAQFDDEVKHALSLSTPFPAPPPELRDSLQGNGVMLGFPL